jgi:chaperonin GroES
LTPTYAPRPESQQSQQFAPVQHRSVADGYSQPQVLKIEARRLLLLVTKIRPLGDRILVKRIKEEDKTKGGIIIPDTAKEKPQEGQVVAVGKGKVTEAGKLTSPDVKAGDRILFGKYSGSEVKLDDEEDLILREDDILGMLEG